MNDKEYKGLQEAYKSVYEALTDQSELDNLRKASAQATMAGPSKEAQALMSDRTKRMLGADKLKAGIAGQEKVQRMMSGAPEPTSPKPTAPTAPITSTSAPKPTTIQPGTFGTTMGPGPTFKGGPVPPPIVNRNAIQPTDWGSIKSPTTSTQTPQAPKPPVADRSADYQKAWDNRGNPLAKGKIRDTWSKMSPEEKAAAKEWAKSNNKNWQEMGLPESAGLDDAYLKVYEQKIGVPLKEPTDRAAKEQLEKMIPKGEKVHTFKSGLQKAHYEPSGEMVEEVDIYDEILEYLLSEGYSEQESNRIMVELVNENFWKAVQQRTGIGKPGVGPGQVAKNILRAGISDILGTSIGAGSAPSASAPVKAPTATTQSPAAIVRTSTKTPRTSPKGANIAPDPWKGGTTGTRVNNITQKPSAKPTSTRALPGSSGSNARALLPSSSNSARGGAITSAAKPGSIAPSAKPGSITPAAKPITGKPTSTRIQPVTVREVPTSTRALKGTNVRALLSQGVRNVLPDPWKQTSDAVSGARNLWSRVQQASKPQSQLKPAQTNVRALLPAAKPTSTTPAAKPATSVRSQQFQDVQRLNRMTGGGLMGELPTTKPASKPAPKPTGNVDKVAPKPTKPAKPAVKPQMPGGGSKILQGLGTLASLRNLTPLGVAAAVMAPRPTADGTLTAAMKRGDVAPPAPKLPAPQKPKSVAPKPATKPSPKPATKTSPKPAVSKPTARPAASKPTAKPVDPDIQKYNELRTSDPAKAKELGNKIWLRKYGVSPSDYA